MSLSGTLANDLRFPGQLFQIETGLAYNWHRHYDATTGRYTQPDPLRFVDGPSVYAYVGDSPLMQVDRQGLIAGSSSNLPHSPKPPPRGEYQICGWSEARKECHELCFHHLFDGSGVGSYRKCVRACLPPEEQSNF